MVMDDRRRKKPAVILFLMFAGAWFVTIVTIQVIQASQTGCGLGFGDNRLPEEELYKDFYERPDVIAARFNPDLEYPGCGSD